MNEMVHEICSNMIESIYMLLSISTNGTLGFYGMLHKFISASEDNAMDDIFAKEEMKCKVGLKTKWIERIVLVNTLVHIFLEDYLPDIISVYIKKKYYPKHKLLQVLFQSKIQTLSTLQMQIEYLIGLCRKK